MTILHKVIKMQVSARFFKIDFNKNKGPRRAEKLLKKDEVGRFIQSDMDSGPLLAFADFP